jgi:hypothetical protein
MKEVQPANHDTLAKPLHAADAKGGPVYDGRCTVCQAILHRAEDRSWREGTEVGTPVARSWREGTEVGTDKGDRTLRCPDANQGRRKSDRCNQER